MDNSKWPARASFPIARPGFKFVLIAILLTGMFFYFGIESLGCFFIAVTLFVSWFFRDPDREPPKDPNSLASPADGKIIVIDELDKCEYLSNSCIKVSIFMNVFNVHVNRMPFDGSIQKVLYHPGKFMNASFDKASVHNERNALVVKADNGACFAVVQIAGLIARRIVNCAKEGERLIKGDRYGMIQFGSRLDLYLPADFKVAVEIGDRTTAGSTVIGYMQ